MKLITKEIENKLLATPLYSTEKQNVVPILVKFFNPYGIGTWLVVEAEKQDDGDWLFFGMAELHEKELGYFTFNELKSVMKFGRPAIERDKWFDNMYLDKNNTKVVSRPV